MATVKGGESAFNLILITTLLTFTTISAQTVAKFGEACNTSTYCELSQTCRDGVCGCSKTEMHFDVELQSCLVKTGDKCRYQLEPEDNYLGYMPPQADPGYEELSCVANSFCNRLGVCACEKHFIDNAERTCTAKGSFGGNCTKDEHCRMDRFLSCVDGRCLCNDRAAIFCPVQQQCVGKADQPCIGSMHACVYNAECTKEESPVSIARYVKMGMPPRVRLNRVCVCRPGHIGDSSGYCRVGLGGPCSDLEPCAESFNCREGECVCPYPSLQVGNTRTQVCMSLVGGPCNETVATEIQPRLISMVPTLPGNGTGNGTAPVVPQKKRSYQCVDNAICVASNNGSGQTMECRCDEGFIEHRDGTCDLAFNSKCNHFIPEERRDPYLRGRQGFRRRNAAMRQKTLAVCDRSTPLTCVNGFCQCESDLYEYDGKGACLGKAGASCRLKPNSTSMDSVPPSVGTRHKCIQGAECTLVRDNAWPVGRCACTSGTMTVDRRCG